MSGIQGLSSDQQQVYNQLINDAGTVNVSRAAVDKELQVAMDAGLSFQEAALPETIRTADTSPAAM